jgi:hypothetical protein
LRTCLVLLVLVLVVSHVSHADGTSVANGTTVATKLEAAYLSEPPVLDGDLGDACWQKASRIEDLTECHTGGKPAEPTTFYLGCDDKYLYLGVYAKDSQPQTIRAEEKKRDGAVMRDDSVEIDIDTYHSHRESYYFCFNSLGTLYESVPQGSASKTEWQGDWEASARKVADGWIGEARIPFSILRYPEGANTFGIVLARHLVRKSEWYVWPAIGEWDYQKSADWGPLKLPKPRPKIKTMVYASPQWDEGSLQTEIGADSKCVFPSGMEALVTVNPDFEDVAQQVESIDFSYTERQLSDARPFFVEGRGFYPPTTTFYSRRLEEVDFGAKYFGRADKYRLAFLDAWDFGHEHTTVANWCWDYRPYSSASVLAVLNEKEGQFNAQYGAGISRTDKVGLQGSRSASINGYSTTVPGGSGTRRRWNAGVGYQTGDGNDNINAYYERVDEGFAPAVAYFPENGCEGWQLSAGRYKGFRNGPLREYDLYANLLRRNDLEGGIHEHSWYVSGSLSMRNWWSGSAAYSATQRPPYHDRVWSLSTSWNNNEKYRGGGVYTSFGTRQGGDYRYFSLSQGFKVSLRLALETYASWLSLDTEEGHTSDRQLMLTGNYDLDPEHTVSMRVVDSSGGTNAYLAYSQKLRRGMDLYVILGDPNTEKTQDRVALKSVWAF